jgi:hypothetical protein
LKGTFALLNDAPRRHAPTDLQFTSLANLVEDLFFALSFIKAQAPLVFLGTNVPGRVHGF